MHKYYMFLVIPLLVVIAISIPHASAILNPSVTSIVRTGGGTPTFSDSFSGSTESIIVGTGTPSPLADDPYNFATEQEYTVTINTLGQSPTVVVAGADLENWSYDGVHTLTIHAKSTHLSITGIPGTGFGLALFVSYGGFPGFDGVYVTTNTNSLSCSETSSNVNCSVNGNETSGVTPFADIYIPGNIIPPSNLKVALNGVTEVQGGSSQSVNATVTNPAPIDRQVTKSGLTQGPLIHLIFHYSSNTISISNSSVTIPEFPAGGAVLLLVISASAYVLIRYRVIRPTHL